MEITSSNSFVRGKERRRVKLSLRIVQSIHN
jgi:hypothetical protein